MISPGRIIIITLSLLILIGWTGVMFFVFQGKSVSSYDESLPIFSLSGLDQWKERFTGTQIGIQDNTTGDSINDANPIQSLSQENTTLYSTQQLSLDEIIASISPQHNHDDQLISTKELEQRYTTTKDPAIATQLITQLSQEFDYKKAYGILITLDSTTIKSLDPHTVMRILFNSDMIVERTQNTTYIDNLIGELLIAGTLEPGEAQRYRALLFLVQDKRGEFVSSLPVFESNSSSIIKPLVSDIRQKIQQSTLGPDLPSSYTDGLIALGMFQYGYPYLSQQLAFRILAEQPNYILPKQILAYSNLILQEWSQAQSYFLQLISDDPKNISNYQFFAGVSSYWIGKHTDAILYLNQIPNDRITSDMLRYKILSYIALKDRKNATSIIRFLSNQEDINEADMMFAREEIAFKPYITKQNSPIFGEDTTILNLYLTTCTNKTLNPLVCQIGEIAQAIMSTSTNYNITTLETIITGFPRSYIYYILGEQYLRQGDTTSAQKSFISALARTSDPDIRVTITKKIEELL